MSKFHVKDTFEIPDRNLFVMAGSIVEGQIRAGMFVRIPLNSSLQTAVRIHRIEFARRQGGEDVCLCMESEPDSSEILRSLDIAGEIIEVTNNGSD